MNLNFLPKPKHKNYLKPLVGTLIIVIVSFVALNTDMLNINPTHELSIISQIQAQPITAIPPSWKISEKIKEAQQLLSGIKLKVGTQDIQYKEDRIAQDSTGKTITAQRTFKEPEKEIALAALNTDTGQITEVTIIKRGADLIAPSPWQIDILERLNGIRWNSWNTAYRVKYPEHHIIIANVYPDESKTAIDYHFYSPYSPDIHTPDLVSAGSDYINSTIQKALTDLENAKVQSVAVSGQSVAKVWSSHSDFFAHIPVLEQTDLTEFILDPQNTVDRIKVIIGANQSSAYSGTCNSSSACGWVQFTPGTYNQIVKSYPKASLIKNFSDGAKDHLNSMKAAILLYDTNLKSLISSSGKKVVNDPKLEEYLAASYNGSPTRAHKSIAAAVTSKIADWINALTSKKGGLASETRGYLTKLRWLQQNTDHAILTDKL